MPNNVSKHQPAGRARSQHRGGVASRYRAYAPNAPRPLGALGSPGSISGRQQESNRHWEQAHHRTLLRRPRHPQQHPTRQLPERPLRHDRMEAQLQPAKPNRKHQLPATPQRSPTRRNVPVAQQNTPRHRSARPSSHLQPRPQRQRPPRRHTHADRNTTDIAALGQRA